jgi:hypothetical protein
MACNCTKRNVVKQASRRTSVRPVAQAKSAAGKRIIRHKIR